MKQPETVLRVLPSKFPYDDVYTVAEFEGNCDDNLFMDYDGHGYPVIDGKYNPNICVKPSTFRKEKALEGYTHVVWFNK
jgi:hypothetical protein